jgi:hypothetical protein
MATLAYAQTSTEGDLAKKKTEVISLMGQMSAMMQDMENLVPGKSGEQRGKIAKVLKDMSTQFKEMSVAFDKDKISDKELAAWNDKVQKTQEKHLGSAGIAKKEGISGEKKDVMVDLMDRMSVVITNVSEVIQRGKDHVLIAKVMMEISQQLNDMSKAVKKDKLPEKEMQRMLDRAADMRAKINSM